MFLRKYSKENWQILLLLILALATRLLFLNYPSEVVFDEVHFGKFVGAYFTNKYYFDIHPPLGKMLIAGFTKISGFNLENQDPDKIFSQIGGQFSSQDFFILRFLPAFFGAILVILVYKLILAMGLSKKSAFLGAFLILFDNAFLVQSKFILVDIFLLVFGFFSLYFFLLSKKYSRFPKKNIFFLTISAVFAALAFSIKWTGFSFWGIIVIWIMAEFLKSRPLAIKQTLKKLAVLTFIPFLIYFLIFIIHLKILYKSGPGDPFMTQSFQKGLLGNNVQKELKPLSVWQQFIELNLSMYVYNKNIKTGHPDASRWYQWPLTQKPIWYWTKNVDGKVANIYLIANPFVWWPVFLSIIFTLFILFKKNWRKKMPSIIYILIFGYFINLLPFIFISRVTFLYHYLPSLTFGILIFVLLWEKFINPEIPTAKKKQKPEIKKGFLGFPSKTRFGIYFAYLLAVLAMFLTLSSISYGFPILQ